MVLSGGAAVGIHSCKDLPVPLVEGTEIFAITAGVDRTDSLIVRDGVDFKSDPAGKAWFHADGSAPVVATSSGRREECVRAMCKGGGDAAAEEKELKFVDIRGTIAVRLQKVSLAGLSFCACLLLLLHACPQLTQNSTTLLPRSFGTERWTQLW
jgi:porphobilinogen deaminase